MNAATRRGLTLVELLASLALLSLVSGACVAWVTSVSRGSMHTLDDRLQVKWIEQSLSLIREIQLRCTDERLTRIDQQGRLMIPTRWWVVVSSGDLDLAQWTRLEHDEDNEYLHVVFLDADLQMLSEPRLVIDAVSSVDTERVSIPDEAAAIVLSLIFADGQQRELRFLAEAQP